MFTYHHFQCQAIVLSLHMPRQTFDQFLASCSFTGPSHVICMILRDVWVRSTSRGNGKKDDMAGAAKDVLDVLVNVLEKLNLGHITENFQRGKITEYQISKLSRQNMEFLGVNDSKAMMSLIRLQCLHYHDGSNPPPRIPETQWFGALE